MYRSLVLTLIALLTSSLTNAQVTLTWTEPTLNEDGTPLTDLSSYDMWYGCGQPGVYDTVETLLAPANTYTVMELSGTCYFSAKAVNSDGVTSAFSNEVVRVVSSLPGAVTDTQITWQESVRVAFVYTDGSSNTGNGPTASTGTHEISINSGDLVVVYVNSNSTTAVTPISDGGAAWTEAVDEQSEPETSRHAFYWKVANGSEGGASTFTVGNAEWHVLIKVFTSATDAEIDLAASTARSGSNLPRLAIATGGRTVAAAAVSIVAGGKDNRATAEDYDTPDSNYVWAIGTTASEAAGMAHRIWTTGGADASTVLIDTADSSDGISDRTYGVHISFVESGGGPAGTDPNLLTLLGVGT